MYNIHVYSRVYRRNETRMTRPHEIKHVIHVLYRKDTHRDTHAMKYTSTHMHNMCMRKNTDARTDTRTLTRAGNRKFIFYGEL